MASSARAKWTTLQNAEQRAPLCPYTAGMGLLRRLLILCPLLLLPGCRGILGIEELPGGGGDHQPDGSVLERASVSPPDAAADGESFDAGQRISDAATERAAGDGCPGHAGPVPVFIASAKFCIDSTEVTNAQYIEFLTSKAGDMSGQPSACDWNTEWTPSYSAGAWPFTGPDGGNGPDLPVVVNWCDAYAYCAWAGKRLCGKTGGGPLDANDIHDPRKNEWFHACSHNNDGLHAFPYGNAYSDGACDTLAGGRVPVGSFATCVGGYPGVYDMSGNVDEWEDSCITTDAGLTCVTGGGNYFYGNYDACATQTYQDAKSGIAQGIRCCGEVSP